MSKLTTAEVAARLGVGRSTVSKWLLAGLLRGERVGIPPRHTWFVTEEDLAAFVPPKTGWVKDRPRNNK